MRNLALFGVCLLGLAYLNSCSDSKDPVSALPNIVLYGTHIQPIFNSSCGGAGCHVPSASFGVNLSNHAAVMASVGTQYGKLVVEAGNPVGSPLYNKLLAGPQHGSRMPLGQSPLRANDIEMIRIWIADGAQNN
jgi:hypothetical protein